MYRRSIYIDRTLANCQTDLNIRLAMIGLGLGTGRAVREAGYSPLFEVSMRMCRFFKQGRFFRIGWNDGSYSYYQYNGKVFCMLPLGIAPPTIDTNLIGNIEDFATYYKYYVLCETGHKLPWVELTPEQAMEEYRENPASFQARRQGPSNS